MIRTKKGGRKSQRPNKQMFETMYYNDSVSAKELAKLWGVAESTIYNWAFQFRHESEISGKNIDLSDKQIFTHINNNKKKERSKLA